MKTRILHLLERLSVNFWMIPLLFLLMGGLLAFVNISLDRWLFSGWGETLPFPFYFKDADNFHSLLSLTAGAMLGVTGVAFSITIASLTLASQQFGPRLLRNFMKTQFNQVVMGFFIGTFLYCVLLLQFSSTLDEINLTPVISLATLMGLIITDLLLLVFFFHHTAMSIQADTIISEVHRELSERLETLFPDVADTNGAVVPTAALHKEEQARFEQEGYPIQTQDSGYLQAIDVAGLQSYVMEHNLALKLVCRPGDFLMQGSRFGWCLGEEARKEETQQAINRYLMIGDTRTAEQDAEFAVRQLVEIAVRAMSPGINDPFTAMTCIDRLGNALAFLLKRQFPVEQYFDEQARLRLQLKPFMFAGIMGAAFNQIRQNTAFHVAVIISLLETLQSLAAQAITDKQKAAIKAQAEAVYVSCQDEVKARADLDDIKVRYQAVLHTLAPQPTCIKGETP